MRAHWRTALVAALAAFGSAALVQSAAIHAKAVVAQWLLERAWTHTLEMGGREPARPWPWADTQPVGRLEVPAYGVDLVVLAGASGRTLAFAPGHLAGSAPLGAPGNAVVAGHRDTHFAFLRDVQLGAEIRVQAADGRRRVYRVVEMGIVHERDVGVLDPFGPTVLTLLTCYPFDTPVPGGPLRWVVIAELESEPSGPAATLRF